MIRSMLLTGLIALSTAADSTHARAPRNHTMCRDVAGTLAASVTRISPTFRGVKIRGRGTSSGDLNGIIEAEVLKPFKGSDLQVAFTIVTPDGTVVARGKTQATATSTPDARLIQSDLSIAGGSGRFLAASGNMNAHGHADTKSRSLSLAYDGQLCMAP